MSLLRALPQRVGAAVLALTVAVGALLTVRIPAEAAIVATVPLGTSGDYAVLAASTVTNTGNSTLDGSLGLWPGTSITGFPPGLVLPPGRTDTTNAQAQQAESDLTVAYLNAAGRPVDATTTADLANLNLQSGVYSGPGKSPLSLTGPLVLDGGGDLRSVFIFQTDSTLITGSGSTVTLINGAQQCNVFWQVGSSATLGTGSVFAGTILALASVTVTNSVTVHGRALARTAAVTLDTDTFTRPTCAQPSSATTTAVDPGTTATTGTGGTTGATPTGGTTGTTTATGTTATTVAASSTETARASGAPGGGDGGTGTTPGGGGTATRLGRPGAPGITSGSPGVPGVVGPPRTGGAALRTETFPWAAVLLAGLSVGLCSAGGLLCRRRPRGRPTPARSPR